MAEYHDMTVPVTRGELREELGKLEQKLDQKLGLWGGALCEFIAKNTAALREQLREDVVGVERRLSAELARHAKANAEDLAARIAVVDDKYKDLPGRVAALEDNRPAPRRKRRRAG
jgi:hypothetical protein